jgi:hypothetical protein
MAVAADYLAGTFPFSAEVPSANFETLQACKDSRCDECQDYDSADGLAVTGDDASLYAGAEAVCNSCFAYVDPD